MKIAVDIDGVLRDTMSGFWKYYNKRNSINYDVNKQSEYKINKILGISLDEACKLLDEYCLSEDFKMVNPIDGSKEAILLLRESHELFAITASPSWMEEMTWEFFEKHFADSFSQLIFSGEFYPGQTLKSKDKICEDLGIGMIVEDNADHSESYANNGLRVLLLDQPWNQEVSHENLIRCGCWNEIVEEIKKIEELGRNNGD
jgi:uncharacterized protein